MSEKISPYIEGAQQFKMEREKTEWTPEEAEMVEAVKNEAEGWRYLKDAKEDRDEIKGLDYQKYKSDLREQRIA